MACDADAGPGGQRGRIKQVPAGFSQLSATCLQMLYKPSVEGHPGSRGAYPLENIAFEGLSTSFSECSSQCWTSPNSILQDMCLGDGGHIAPLLQPPLVTAQLSGVSRLGNQSSMLRHRLQQPGEAGGAGKGTWGRA